MSYQYRYINEPDWNYEAVVCILESSGERVKELLEKSSRYNMTKEELLEKLQPIVSYQETVYPILVELLDNYPSIKPYFSPTKKEKEPGQLPIILGYVSIMEERKLSTKKEIDSFMNEYYSRGLENDVGETREFKSLEDVIDFCNQLGNDTEDSDKMRIINFYSNRYVITKDLKNFLRKAVPICKKYRYMVEDLIQDICDQMEQNDFFEHLKNTGLTLNLEDGEYEFTIHPTVICFNQCSLSINQKIGIISVGVYFYDKFGSSGNDNQINDESLVAKLKAVGDNTRIRILHLLANRSMYLQELATELKLTPATVSHHVNILLNEKLIQLTLNGEVNAGSKNIYYEICREKLEDLSKELFKLAQENIS